MAVSALAERRGRQCQGLLQSADALTQADAIAVSFISVAVCRSCTFQEIFAVYGSYYVAKGRQMNCDTPPTVDGER